MQSSFGRPYPAPQQPRNLVRAAATAPGTLVLIVTYAVASFALLAFGLSQGA